MLLGRFKLKKLNQTIAYPNIQDKNICYSLKIRTPSIPKQELENSKLFVFRVRVDSAKDYQNWNDQKMTYAKRRCMSPSFKTYDVMLKVDKKFLQDGSKSNRQAVSGIFTLVA